MKEQMNDIDQKLLAELKKGSTNAFETLYRNHYRMIVSLITKMGGQPEDAEDVFQEALFVLVKRIREPDFELTSKVSTFLYSIARNLWLKKSGKDSKEFNVTNDEFMKLGIASVDNKAETKQKELLIAILLDRLNMLEEECQKVIRMTFVDKMSHAEVATQLGYSISFIKVKKFRCLGYLRKLVKDSPFYKTMQIE